MAAESSPVFIQEAQVIHPAFLQDGAVIVEATFDGNLAVAPSSSGSGPDDPEYPTPPKVLNEADLLNTNVIDLDWERANRRPVSTYVAEVRTEVIDTGGTPLALGAFAVGKAESRRTESTEAISADDRSLTEVDHLNDHRQADSSIPEWVYRAVLINQITALKEAAIPHAVSKTFQRRVFTGEYDKYGAPLVTYLWLDQTSTQVAESGYAFHRHPDARAGVDVEVDEAGYNDRTMRDGYAKVLISVHDKELKDENLGDKDSLRISYPGRDEKGEEGKILESILIGDVPRDSWEAMLADPNNLWGRSIMLEQPNSRLAIMKAHRQLEIPLERLPEGVVSLLVAVLPYVHDPNARKSITRQIMLFRGDQEELHRQATAGAIRWAEFEKSLADSLIEERATRQVELFIGQLQHQWSDADIALFNAHTLEDGGFRMSRRLAARLERAKQNLLWTAAAVVAGNEAVLDQLDTESAQAIYRRELLIQHMVGAGASMEDIMAIEAKNNKSIAAQNVTVGGGCPGENSGGFRESASSKKGKGKEHKWETHKGVCRTKECPNHTKIVEVGPCEICIELCQPIYDEGGDPESLPSAA